MEEKGKNLGNCMIVVAGTYDTYLTKMASVAFWDL